MNAVNRAFFCWVLPLLAFGFFLGWWLRGREERRKRHDATVGSLIEKRSFP